MKWFRHFSNASTSLKLNGLIDKLGLKGYGQYWLLIELLNDKFDGVDASSIHVHQSELLTSLRVRYVGTLGELLGNMKGLDLFDYSRDERVYSFNCPILLELMDKDSRYNKKVNRISVASCDELANNRYKKKNKKENNTNPIVPLDSEIISGSENLLQNFDPSKFLDAKKILSEVETQDIPKFTPDHFVDLWNKYFGGRLANAIGLGGGIHRDNFLASLEYLPTEKHWADLFELCLQSPRLMGQNDIGWSITPTWIVNFDNSLKVLNGDFEDGKAVKNLFASMKPGASA